MLLTWPRRGSVFSFQAPFSSRFLVLGQLHHVLPLWTKIPLCFLQRQLVLRLQPTGHCPLHTSLGSTFALSRPSPHNITK